MQSNPVMNTVPKSMGQKMIVDNKNKKLNNFTMNETLLDRMSLLYYNICDYFNAQDISPYENDLNKRQRSFDVNGDEDILNFVSLNYNMKKHKWLKTIEFIDSCSSRFVTSLRNLASLNCYVKLSVRKS